jgi:hypothetical protein
MPTWLPPEAEEHAPLAKSTLEWKGTVVTAERAGGRQISASGAGGDRSKADRGYRIMVTQEGFKAREGEGWDETHERDFASIDYAYVWDGVLKRWVMRVRVHWAEPVRAPLAADALRGLLAMYCATRAHMRIDPTQPWGDVIDLWLMEGGEPGALTVGRSIYLYSVGTERPGAEWLRQLAHEYGHVSLPGIGKFTDTDDPYADGNIAELLLPKWLKESGVPEWTPWPSDGWIESAAAERKVLLDGMRETGANEEPLQGVDAQARDYFVGLVLHVEEVAGPRFVADVLKQCPGGTPTQFVSAASKSAGTIGLDLWHGLAGQEGESAD